MEPRPPKTVTEEVVLDLSIQLIESKFAVEEAFIRQKWHRAVKMLIKERRDQKGQDEK